MGSALRKELFGDDSRSDTESDGAPPETDADQERASSTAQKLALKDYETFLDGQEEYKAEVGDGISMPAAPPPAALVSTQKFEDNASDILYRLCAHTEVTAEQASTLIRLGADPNYVPKGNNGNGLLHMLARRGVSADSVRVLLDAGCVPHTTNRYNQTALMLASDTNRLGDCLEIVKILCQEKKGLDLELRDLGGNSALMNSIFKSNVWICRELLLAGASAVHGDPTAFHVALWLFSESLAQDLETLPKEIYEGNTCCLPVCPLGSPMIDYEGSNGWLRVLFQGFRMPDVEIVLRMVYRRKEAEHMFDDTRRDDKNRPIYPALKGLVNNRRGNDNSSTQVSSPTERDNTIIGASAIAEADSPKQNPVSDIANVSENTGVSNPNNTGKAGFLRAERVRHNKKRADWKRQKVQSRKEKREMEERQRLDVKFVDLQQSIEETFSHTVAPKRRTGKDMWKRAHTAGRWSRPEDDVVEYE